MKTKKFTCSYENCTSAFPLNKTLLRHVKLVHQNVKNFTCNICDKKFQTSGHLQRHVNTHNDEYNFPCNTCDGKFKTNYELNAHVTRKHTITDTMFKCDYDTCTAQFKMKNDFAKHLKCVHGNETFSCNFDDNCDKIYKTKKDLDRHIERFHKQIRNFKCDTCDVQFYTNYELTAHKNQIHNDERKFECDLCDKSFKINGALTTHIKEVHSDERRFVCKDCDKTFKRNSHYKLHYNYNHTEEGHQIQKKKEHEISKLLDKHGISYKREHQIDFKCIQSGDTYCRIDFVIIKDGIVIFLEIDEEQHLWYSQACETRRMAQVFQSLMIDDNTLPVVFLRYNPDKFYIDEEEQKLTKIKRHEILIDEINKCDTITTNTIKYLFYNTLDNVPEVLNDVEYLSEIKSLVNYTKMNS